MDSIHRLNDLDINVKTSEVGRLLGYGREEIPERVMSILAEIEDRAPELIDPKCAWRRLRRHDLTHSPYLHYVDDVALCLVTIGSKLEEQLEEFKRDGQLGRALVLDMYGSAAAESAADAANAVIEAELSQAGYYCSNRFSPGYACWDVKEQEWVLPTLEGQELGVKLTEGFMMSPRKSITFAVTVADSPVQSMHEHSCGNCGMVDCLYKRDE
ncbi:MAG: vitamin B12 dependent-methionine synthase activation domain-containing protein [Candidatus Latescibacterota bacterium]|jgi:hypothetical protein